MAMMDFDVEPNSAARPEVTDVVFDATTAGKAASFTVRVHPEWAPQGAAQFLKLVREGWYDDSRAACAIPGFIAQFGLPATPKSKLPAIRDDAVKKSNLPGTLAYAASGSNTRTPLFFHYDDKSFLDEQGYSPFGEVLGDGMKVVANFYDGYGDEPEYGRIVCGGQRVP